MHVENNWSTVPSPIAIAKANCPESPRLIKSCHHKIDRKNNKSFGSDWEADVPNIRSQFHAPKLYQAPSISEQCIMHKIPAHIQQQPGYGISDFVLKFEKWQCNENNSNEAQM